MANTSPKRYTETFQARVDPRFLEMIDVIRATRRPIPSRVEVIREAIEALHREQVEARA